jgi:glycerophosphoryl diester phosphodiesterase
MRRHVNQSDLLSRSEGGRSSTTGQCALLLGVAIIAVLGCATPSAVMLEASTSEEPELARYPKPFQIIAHRGASAYAPENTLPAFRAALELGAFEVELDVQLSKDGVVMLYHDDNLEKKTGESGRVRDYSVARLQELDIGRWFDRVNPDLAEKFSGTRLNTLEELFEAFGSALYYHIELKSPDPELPGRTHAAVERADLTSRARITSFEVEQLLRSVAIAPALPHTLLIRDAAALREEEGGGDAKLLELQKRKIDFAVASGFDQVGIASEDLSPTIVRYATDAHVSVRAWRIRTESDMLHAIDMGACGMTTNWPDRLIRKLVEDMGSPGL